MACTNIEYVIEITNNTLSSNVYLHGSMFTKPDISNNV